MTETMRFRTIVTAVCMVAVSGWIGTALGEEFSLGKIDLQELYRKSRRMQLAYHTVREIQLESNVKLGKFQQEAKDIETKLKEEKDSLKSDQRSELLGKLKAKRDEIKSEREALRVKLDFKRKSIESSLGPEVKSAIATVAKEAGLKAVLPAGVFAYDAGIADITDKVVRAFDAAETERKPAAGKPEVPGGKD